MKDAQRPQCRVKGYTGSRLGRSGLFCTRQDWDTWAVLHAVLIWCVAGNTTTYTAVHHHILIVLHLHTVLITIPQYFQQQQQRPGCVVFHLAEHNTPTNTHTVSFWHLNVLMGSLSSPGFSTQRMLQRNNRPIIYSLGLIHISLFPILQHDVLKNKLRRNSGGQNSLRQAYILDHRSQASWF